MSFIRIQYQHATCCKCIQPIGHVYHLSSLGADQSIKLVKNYTVFQNDTPAMFYCYGNGYENGAVVGWILNGTGYGSKHAQRRIRVVTDTPIGDTVSSRLFIPSNYTINNGTEVKCTAIDSTLFTLIVTSEPASLTLQGECCNITRMCTLSGADPGFRERGGLINIFTTGGGYGRGSAPSRDSKGVWGSADSSPSGVRPSLFSFCVYLA